MFRKTKKEEAVLLEEWGVGVGMAVSEIRGQRLLQSLALQVLSGGRDGCRRAAENPEQAPGEAMCRIAANSSPLLFL